MRPPCGDDTCIGESKGVMTLEHQEKCQFLYSILISFEGHYDTCMYRSDYFSYAI